MDQQNQKPESIHDPLLECLMFIARYYHKPQTLKSLTAGLPLSEDHRLTTRLFLQAVEKINLAADIFRKPLKNFTDDELPAVVLLDKNQACVILNLTSKNQAMVYNPNVGKEPVETSLDELTSQYLGYAISVKPLHQFDRRSEEPIQAKKTHWFWDVVYRFWPIYGEIAVAALLINIFALASPIFVMNVYNRIIPVNAMESLWALAIGMAIIIGFDFLMRTLRGNFIERAGRAIDIELSDKIFAQILDLETSSRPAAVGSLVNTMQSFDHFREFITATTISVLVDFPFIFLFLLVIFLLGGWIVLVPLVLMPFALIVGLIIQRKIVNLVNHNFRYGAEKNALLVEILTNIENVKGMSLEGMMQKKWNLAEKSSSNKSTKLKELVNLSNNFAVFTQQVSYVGVIIAGVYKVAEGNFTVGALIACSILAGRAIAPIIQICGLISRYQQSKASLSAINKIMQLPTERPHTSQFIHYKKFKGAIEMKDVSFAYQNQPVNVLENISFKISPKEKVAIIGRTGSGKSTILKLLMRFYLPTSGYILLDGSNLNQIDPAEYRSEIGYVPQHVALFYGTLKENIAMHTSLHTPIDDDKIRAVAELCNLKQIINTHPDGYNRQVGEGGQSLSSGQRQMVAIARSLVIDPPILIWDEPTNAIDDTTAQLLLTKFKEMFKDKTLIMSTHKPNALILVDRLIVIDNGKIVADGPKEEILQAINEKKIKIRV